MGRAGLSAGLRGDDNEPRRTTGLLSRSGCELALEDDDERAGEVERFDREVLDLGLESFEGRAEGRGEGSASEKSICREVLGLGEGCHCLGAGSTSTEAAV